jgi:hypothetical protein
MPPNTFFYPVSITHMLKKEKLSTMQFRILAFAFVIYNEMTKKEAVLNGIHRSVGTGTY